MSFPIKQFALFVGLYLLMAPPVRAEVGIITLKLAQEFKAKLLKPLAEKCKEVNAKILRESVNGDHLDFAMMDYSKMFCTQARKMTQNLEDMERIAGYMHAHKHGLPVQGTDRYAKMSLASLEKTFGSTMRSLNNTFYNNCSEAIRTGLAENFIAREKLDRITKFVWQENGGKQDLKLDVERQMNNLLFMTLRGGNPKNSSGEHALETAVECLWAGIIILEHLQNEMGGLEELEQPDSQHCKFLAWTARQFVVIKAVLGLRFAELKPEEQEWNEWKDSEWKCGGNGMTTKK